MSIAANFQHLTCRDYGLLIRTLESLSIGNALLCLTKLSPIETENNLLKSLISLSVPPGVLKGNHLSHFLFILFVNSVNKWITKAKNLLFADDFVKIYLNIYALQS
ncbi:unnamed protein product [Macrosiphum euphorbiae]|uniref:Reverse transcriptase domain-containing protein n=1 Tax=Macrosiphum euphorbiae TaxID=13131 RepID=A0AAV0W757_9HEMI|nr:unnamed protein product [Macrosiphum euphorbiae]